MLRRFGVLTVLILALGPVVRSRAQPAPANSPAPNTGAAPTALPPDLQAELDALQIGAWHPSLEARGSVGWRDNVLLSPFAPLARAFGRAELDAMLLRPMRNRWEFVSFLSGDVLRYFSPPPETGGEQQWSLHTEGRWQPVDAARLSLKAAGYLRDMVLDLSETEAQRVVAPTRVRGGYVGAAVRFTLPAGFRLEPAVQVKRSDYRAYAGDYSEQRGGARLEWRRTDALALSAAWFESQRDYSQRTEYSASGRALAGTRLGFRQRDAELKARTAWKGGGEWSVAVTAGQLENRDGASGYFDYDQKRGRLEVGWNRAAWRVMLDGDVKRMTYRGQTVGAGLAPPARLAEDFETTLRVERELSPRWTLFSDYHWERSRSNELEFSYRANTVLAGIQRSF
jgi:hypothetical protein